jgi:hypothetical protein
MSSTMAATVAVTGVRPPLLAELGRRLLALPRQIRENLATNYKYQWPSALGYTLGALSTIYSVVALLYEYRIDLTGILRMPFRQFFTDQVLPFLASPLQYVGIELGSRAEALLAISAIGGSILANAEFRTDFRFARHVFGKSKPMLNFDLDEVFKDGGLPEPPSHSVKSRAALFLAALVLGYSMVGLAAFAVFVPFGVYFLLRDVRYLLAWIAGNVLYVAEHLLAPYERWGDDEYWGTRWFLAVYRRRRALDEFLRTDYVDFWRADSLDPRYRHWNAVKRSFRDGGRVVALAMWTFLIALAPALLR